VLKPKPKGLKIGKSNLKSPPKEPPNKVYNVKTWTRAPLKKSNHMTLIISLKLVKDLVFVPKLCINRHPKGQLIFLLGRVGVRGGWDVSFPSWEV